MSKDLKSDHIRMLVGGLLVAAAATGMAPSPARAGGSSAHGGDLDRDQDNVWFLGDTPVEYCITRKDDYPLGQDQLAGLVEAALADWRAFFAKYGIDTRQFTDLPDGKARGLALTFQRVDSCLHPAEQLQFAFDVHNEMVQDHRPDDDLSLGVSVRGPYNHATYRSGGVVWMAHWTTDPALIKHLLLHELGHVFGMPHNSVWVMDDTVARRLTDAGERRDPAIGSIESPAWPFLVRAGETLDFTYRFPAWSDKPAGYAPNYVLPSGMMSLFGLGLHDYFGGHRLTLAYRPVFEPGQELPFGRKSFLLSFERPGQPTEQLNGVFDLVYVRGAGPALYTRWRQPADRSLVFAKRFLFDEAFPVPASGYFLTPAGDKIPAIISSHWGPVLRVFTAGSGVWWNTESYELSVERQQMDQY